MRRAITTAIAVGLAGVLFAGSSAQGRGTKTVNVGDDFFDPVSMTIKQNTTLKFTWVGEDPHNVFKESGPGKYFESDNTDETGFVFAHKFRKAGRYTLGCILHEDMDMSLKVRKKRRS